MRIMWIIIIAFILLGLSIGGFAYAHFDMRRNANNDVEVDKKYDKSRRFWYEIDTIPEKTKALALEQYKICPPLRPERFRRRIKMLWGIDVNDYPEDALICFGVHWETGHFTLSIKHQTMNGVWYGDENAPIPYDLFDKSIYVPLRQCMLFADMETTSDFFKNYPLDIYNKLNAIYNYSPIDSEPTKNNVSVYYDILRLIYDCVYSTSPSILSYMDEKSRLLRAEPYAPHIFVYNNGTPDRLSEIKANLVSLYIKEQLNRGRKLTPNMHPRPKEDELWIGYRLDKEWDFEYKLTRIASPYVSRGDGVKFFPWRMDTKMKGSAAYLSFLLQLDEKIAFKTVILYMSGQLDNKGYIEGQEYKYIREQIRSNNYYGYAILREFCENPEREMPTLEKVGTSFNAKVIQPKTLLLLEPYPDSYDIDTIKQEEIFKAYEMGYDDYYFIEVIKPVESPVAGPDGYAIILDRTETVYGYIRKSEVKEIPESEIENQKIMSQLGERKLGRIDDPDGYVNIRKESNAESEVVGKIVEKELFFYWEIADSNWWYVETKDAIKGFVYKSRIKEKIDAGGWIIDE